MVPRRPAPIVFGCAGRRLSDAEAAFFAESDPLGLILFARNCDTPDQVSALVADFRTVVGRADAPVLIDQEGGRVRRLRPPHWPAHPSARRIGALAERDPSAGDRAAWLGGRLLADTLYAMGITVNCAPVCDVTIPGAHDVIGDRAFSGHPVLVARLAVRCCEGLEAGGVMPVIKHVPGHGRTMNDSHVACPVVEASLADLARHDFVPFAALANQPAAMVAHVRYLALDAERPASQSAAVVGDVIRRRLRFDGVLFTDDIVMDALSGEPADRAMATLAAGCDVVLHCDGDLDAMRAVAMAVPAMTPAAAVRWDQAARRWQPPQPLDVAAARAEFGRLMALSEE